MPPVMTSPGPWVDDWRLDFHAHLAEARGECPPVCQSLVRRRDRNRQRVVAAKTLWPPWTVARLCVMDVQLQLTRRKTRRSILEINHAPLQCMFRSDGCAVPDQLDGFDCSSFIFSRPSDHTLICLQLSTRGEGPQSDSASMGPPSQKGTDLQGGAGGAVESRQLQ